MRQLQARLEPWAPTMLGTGLFASLAESLHEMDLTSIAFLLVALLGFALVVRQHRGLTRGEVRAEVAAGIRAMVRDDARYRNPALNEPVFTSSRVAPGLAQANRVTTTDEASTLNLSIVPKEDP